MPGSGSIRRDDEPTNADLRTVLLDVREKVNHVHKIITGGERPSEGMIVRVDRLEQSQNASSRVGWAALTTAVGTGVAWVLSHIGSGTGTGSGH